MFQPTNKH